MTRSSMRFATAVVLLGGTLAASKLSDYRKAVEGIATPLASIPLTIDGWAGTEAPRLSDGVENKLLATDYLARVYRREGRELSLFISYYAQQRAGESMHSPWNCLPGAGWEAWDYKTVQVPFGSGKQTANLYSVQKDGTRMQVLYWYQSPERVIASEYAGKAYLVWDALVHGRTSGTLVRITMLDDANAVADEIGFATSVMAEVERCLREK